MKVLRGTFKLSDWHGTRFAACGGNARQRRRQVRAWKRQGYRVADVIGFQAPPASKFA